MLNSHLNEYNIQVEIGHGSFATVFRGIHIETRRVVAIKKIDKSQFSEKEEDQLNAIEREISISKMADHPLIVHLYDVFEEENYIYMVMEYVDGENLLDYINETGQLPEDQVRFLFQQLISAIDYLHKELKVVHRDLKAENILIDRYGNLRLIDFGLSFVAAAENEDIGMKTVCGSPAYAAPELIKGQEYTRQIDIWSSGVILYAMSTGRLPFYDVNISKLLQKIVLTEPDYSNSISPSLVLFIQKILNKNPKERITIDEMKENSWFNYGQFSHTNFSAIMASSNLKINKIPLSEKSIETMRKTNKTFDEDELSLEIEKGMFETSAAATYRILRNYQLMELVLQQMMMQRSPLSLKGKQNPAHNSIGSLQFPLINSRPRGNSLAYSRGNHNVMSAPFKVGTAGQVSPSPVADCNNTNDSNDVNNINNNIDNDNNEININNEINGSTCGSHIYMGHCRKQRRSSNSSNVVCFAQSDSNGLVGSMPQKPQSPLVNMTPLNPLNPLNSFNPLNPMNSKGPMNAMGQQPQIFARKRARALSSVGPDIVVPRVAYIQNTNIA